MNGTTGVVGLLAAIRYSEYMDRYLAWIKDPRSEGRYRICRTPWDFTVWQRTNIVATCPTLTDAHDAIRIHMKRATNA